jgi:hypothetical protein
VIKKPLLCDCEFFGKDKKMHKGEYIFTIDNCHRDQNVLNTNFAEHDPEHKSFNIIKMDNGQFAAQPNNRVIFTDQSLVHPDRKTPDFKVCSQNYTVENTPKWSVGHTDDWQYKTKDEIEYVVEDGTPNSTIPKD